MNNIPTITINGQTLTEGEAMTVHVAIQNYTIDLTSKKYPLGRDKHGQFMTKSYLENISSINRLLSRTN